MGQCHKFCWQKKIEIHLLGQTCCHANRYLAVLILRFLFCCENSDVSHCYGNGHSNGCKEKRQYNISYIPVFRHHLICPTLFNTTSQNHSEQWKWRKNLQPHSSEVKWKELETEIVIKWNMETNEIISIFILETNGRGRGGVNEGRNICGRRYSLTKVTFSWE